VISLLSEHPLLDHSNTQAARHCAQSSARTLTKTHQPPAVRATAADLDILSRGCARILPSTLGVGQPQLGPGWFSWSKRRSQARRTRSGHIVGPAARAKYASDCPVAASGRGGHFATRTSEASGVVVATSVRSSAGEHVWNARGNAGHSGQSVVGSAAHATTHCELCDAAVLGDAGQADERTSGQRGAALSKRARDLAFVKAPRSGVATLGISMLAACSGPVPSHPSAVTSCANARQVALLTKNAQMEEQMWRLHGGDRRSPSDVAVDSYAPRSPGAAGPSSEAVTGTLWQFLDIALRARRGRGTARAARSAVAACLAPPASLTCACRVRSCTYSCRVSPCAAWP
jgi:hypothetical protein